jgi:hypothetical protein
LLHAIGKVVIDQLLVGYARFLGLLLEIIDGLGVKIDRYLLLKLRRIRVLHATGKIIVATHGLHLPVIVLPDIKQGSFAG